MGRGKLQQQSLLRQHPAPGPAKPPPGIQSALPPELVRLQKALDLEPYVRYVESLDTDQKTQVNRSGPHGTIQYDYDICDVNYRRESESEAESDVLDAAEEEAKRLPVTKLHVACFDRMKKRKR